MNPEITPHVALAVDDLETAATYYREHFGWKRGQSTTNWIQMVAGPMSFYLCLDEDAAPCFALDVDELETAKAHFLARGCRLLREEGGEAFIEDQYGYHFCLSPRSS
ncbi:MAG: hypothetical protein JSS66_13015 [Armatimonadetes bacterium]|nr:hypothetical protein [Armatimonadota bacterium]